MLGEKTSKQNKTAGPGKQRLMARKVKTSFQSKHLVFGHTNVVSCRKKKGRKEKQNSSAETNRVDSLNPHQSFQWITQTGRKRSRIRSQKS